MTVTSKVSPTAGTDTLVGRMSGRPVMTSPKPVCGGRGGLRSGGRRVVTNEGIWDVVSISGGVRRVNVVVVVFGLVVVEVVVVVVVLLVVVVGLFGGLVGLFGVVFGNVLVVVVVVLSVVVVLFVVVVVVAGVVAGDSLSSSSWTPDGGPRSGK